MRAWLHRASSEAQERDLYHILTLKRTASQTEASVAEGKGGGRLESKGPRSWWDMNGGFQKRWQWDVKGQWLLISQNHVEEREFQAEGIACARLCGRETQVPLQKELKGEKSPQKSDMDLPQVALETLLRFSFLSSNRYGC